MSTKRNSSSEGDFVEGKLQVNRHESQNVATVRRLLEEKNSVIDRLTKQIQNQRIQLEFYIKKEMNSPLMVALSKTCIPQLTDDNMAVNLAINKFYKELGMKSRIMDLYDTVYDIASRTNQLIHTQEMILGEVLTKLKNNVEPNSHRQILGNFDVNANYVEVFNNLLETTFSLRQSLQSIRSCCDNLVNTEDRRNEIVEMVYALPHDERTICNYMINIRMEKLELENMLKHITKKCKIMEPSMDEIDVIANNLKLLHQHFDTIQEEDAADCTVSKMLEKVYNQAMSLLALSRDQRVKYQKERDLLKEENAKLREVILHMEQGTKEKAANDCQDVEKLHATIRRTINQARKFEKHKTEELQKKNEECETLKRKLSEVVSQKRHLQTYLDSTDPSEFMLEHYASVCFSFDDEERGDSNEINEYL